MAQHHVRIANDEMPGREMSPENQNHFRLFSKAVDENAITSLSEKGLKWFFHIPRIAIGRNRAAGAKVFPYNPGSKTDRTFANIQRVQQNLNAKLTYANQNGVIGILCHLRDLNPSEKLSQGEINGLFTEDDKFKYRGVLNKELLNKLSYYPLSKHQIDTLEELIESKNPPTPLNCPETGGIPTREFYKNGAIENLAVEEAEREKQRAKTRRRPVPLNREGGGRSRRRKNKSKKTRRPQKLL